MKTKFDAETLKPGGCAEEIKRNALCETPATGVLGNARELSSIVEWYKGFWAEDAQGNDIWDNAPIPHINAALMSLIDCFSAVEVAHRKIHHITGAKKAQAKNKATYEKFCAAWHPLVLAECAASSPYCRALFLVPQGLLFGIEDNPLPPRILPTVTEPFKQAPLTRPAPALPATPYRLEYLAYPTGTPDARRKSYNEAF
ncbi:hypothetical protein BJY04DRAFT_221570 [Aspergillus karnatakaensis]|uniref:uncharacterized protein n=1 Tax=Aspergillus karnatakaensis TaxID=1810916 RepID=UPI003CCD67C9